MLGSVHGLLITRVHLQPFIVTLCGLLFYRGMARFIADDETKGFGNAHGLRVPADSWPRAASAAFPPRSS